MQNDDDRNKDKPKIYKIAHIGGKKISRRNFVKGLTIGTGAVTLSTLINGCSDDITVETNNEGKCICHVVDSDHEYDSLLDSEYNGTTCTCNTVCVCNTVCTCNTVGGSSCCSSDSCGSHYWYPN